MRLKIKIFDRPWQIILLDEEEFEKRFPGNDGVTMAPIYKVYLSTSALRMDVIAHEVFHAYRSMLCSSSASITKEQEEEISCELFGVYHKDMIQLSKTILREFRDEQD